MFIKRLKVLILSVGILASSSVSGCKSDQLKKSWKQIGFDNNASQAHSLPKKENTPGKNAAYLKSYFVSSDGSDNNPGTIELPFKTIQKCANTVQPGTTCWIRKGTYRETIAPKISGTRAKPVIFSAYQQEQVTISGTELLDDWSEHNDLSLSYRY